MVFGIKIEEVGGVGALEAIDGLIIVAYSHNIWAAFVAWVVCKEANEFCLCVVCILELIKKDILEAFLGIVTNLVVSLKEIDGV